jgi:hypothetical protein
MKWYIRLICIALIITGFFTSFSLWLNLTAESSTHGEITIAESEQIGIFDKSFNYLVFTSTGIPNVVEYSESYSARVDFDGNRNDYEIQVNGYPCYINTVSAGRIAGSFSMTFYNLSGQAIVNAILEISLSFYNDHTELKIVMNNAGIAASYFNNYVSSDGFNIWLGYSLLVFNKGGEQ